MLKICGNTIGKRLKMILNQALLSGLFLSEWKIGMSSLFTKKKKTKPEMLSFSHPAPCLWLDFQRTYF